MDVPRMTVLGIDPGSANSAIVAWDGTHIELADDMPNENVREALADSQLYG